DSVDERASRAPVADREVIVLAAVRGSGLEQQPARERGGPGDDPRVRRINPECGRRFLRHDQAREFAPEGGVAGLLTFTFVLGVPEDAELVLRVDLVGQANIAVAAIRLVE